MHLLCSGLDELLNSAAVPKMAEFTHSMLPSCCPQRALQEKENT
jgi:hypothetical protein